MQVEAGMCRKSRDGQNTANTDAKVDTDRKTPKKTMRNGQPSRFLDSAARRLWHLFAKKHRKYRRNQKSQNKFREESAKTRVSAHASQEIDTPRAVADARAANNNNNNNTNNTNSTSNTNTCCCCCCCCCCCYHYCYCYCCCCCYYYDDDDDYDCDDGGDDDDNYQLPCTTDASATAAAIATRITTSATTKHREKQISAADATASLLMCVSRNAASWLFVNCSTLGSRWLSIQEARYFRRNRADSPALASAGSRVGARITLVGQTAPSSVSSWNVHGRDRPDSTARIIHNGATRFPHRPTVLSIFMLR